MERINPDTRIDKEKLNTLLLERRKAKDRFNLPMTSRQVADAMLAAIMAEVQFRKTPFVSSESVDRQIRQISQWLTTNDCRYCCLLHGNIGSGKTTFVNALRNLVDYLEIKDRHDGERCEIQMVDANEIIWLYQADHQKWSELCQRKMLAIDNVGTESIAPFYPTSDSPVAKLLHKRYDEQLFTVIATDLHPEELRDMYGVRFADRLCEMVCNITFANPSYRSGLVHNQNPIKNKIKRNECTI